MNRAITKRMDTLESDVQKLFTHLYCKRDFEQKLKEAKRAKADRLPFVLRDIADMIGGTGILCEYGKSLSYYSRLIATLELPENADGINMSMIKALSNIYRDYPTPREFMERIVYFLAPDESGTDSLELKIFKRFLKTVNVKENKRYYSKKLSTYEEREINESLFDSLRDKEAKKSDTPPLVEAAYSLANGNFVSPVTTKELLYLFAFAFGMRYYSSRDTAGYLVMLDVEKNLFEDYYCDNLTRYIYLEDGGKSGNSDKEPSGVGLNPKSFVDTIFIYYLNKDGISASEKVSGFYRTVSFVKNAWNKMHSYDDAKRLSFAALPTDKFVYDVDNVISSMSEDEFVSYILNNYYCDLRYTYPNKKTGALREGTRGPFEFRVPINSAYIQYRAIIDLIRNLLDLPANADLSRLDKRTVKDVCDGEGFDSMFSDEKDVVIMRLSELEANARVSMHDYFSSLVLEDGELGDFLSIIQNLEKRLDPYEVIGITDPLKVTRTKLIAAYFHYYCLENSLDAERDGWKSLKTVYEDMSYCLNLYLIDAGYQRISSKNLYDALVIFLAYSKINGFLS